MNEFRKLGISQPILRVIEEEMFEKPSEIQEKSIPLVLSGKNVIAGSATGSGKTLAFGSGIIQNCERGKGLQALVLTPTRELAQQESEALKKFSKYQDLNIIPVYGGVAINPQIDKLRTTDVVVGTPGRILDHMQRKTMRLSEVKILVLDEADRMFDMGFLDDVEKIIHACPREKQMLLFSATITHDVDRLWKRYMRDAVKVSAEAYVDPAKMTQVYYNVADNLKFSLFVHLLKGEHSGLVMVFCKIDFKKIRIFDWFLLFWSVLFFLWPIFFNKFYKLSESRCHNMCKLKKKYQNYSNSNLNCCQCIFTLRYF